MENKKQNSVVWRDFALLAIGVIIILGILFFAVHKSHAAAAGLLQNQTDDSALTSSLPSGAAGYGILQKLGSGLTGSITGITLEGISHNGGYTILPGGQRLLLCANTTSSGCEWSYENGSKCVAVFRNISDIPDTTSTLGTWFFEKDQYNDPYCIGALHPTSTFFSFDPNVNYSLELFVADGVGTGAQLAGSADVNSYPHGNCYFSGGASCTAPGMFYTGTAHDWYFQTNLDESIIIEPYGGASGSWSVNSTSSSFFVLEDCSVFNGSLLSSSTLSNIGCQLTNIIRSTAEWFIVPSSDISGYLQNQYKNFQNTFPFSLVYSIMNGVESGVASGDSSSASLTLSVPAIGLSSSLLSPTTLSDAVGSSTKNLLFDAAKMVIWVGVGIKSVMMIL